jgi:hypothetical protein
LEISHIQACQKNRTVNETANLVSTCNCAGKCNAMRYSCRKSKIPCSSKCHKQTLTKCCNK